MGTFPEFSEAGKSAFSESLRALLLRTESRDARRRHIRDLASDNPGLFFSAGLSLLRSEQNSDTRRTLYARLVDYPEFLSQLARPEQLSREDAVEVSREFMCIDAFFDMRLARLIPRGQDEPFADDVSWITRMLDILNEISSGSRLILLLIHLARHPNPQIASKAALLTSRRVQNDRFAERNLASSDARLRANVVEGLWGVQTSFARRTMRGALRDSSPRVVGNGLVGLHLLGDQSVEKLVKRMLRDDRAPFRRTAAWVMGQIGATKFGDSLRHALNDQDPGVRQAVRRALNTIRQAASSTQPPPPPEVIATPVEPESSISQIATEPTKEPRPELQQPLERATEPEELSEEFDIRLDGTYASSRRR